MSPLLRYVLLQIPGILAVSVVLHVAWSNDIISATVAWAVLALWLLKDALFYPLVRRALEKPAPLPGAQALVGEMATARTEITERGMVRIRGELWQARTRDRTRIPAGSAVVVVSAQGLWLTVAGASRARELAGHVGATHEDRRPDRP